MNTKFRLEGDCVNGSLRSHLKFIEKGLLLTGPLASTVHLTNVSAVSVKLY